MKLVICGAGPAGVEAAIAARNAAPEAEIVLLSGEKVLPYRRPALSDLIKGGEINEIAFYIKKQEFYTEKAISLRLNTTVTAIAEKSLRCADGTVENFDSLIIATGGRAVLPPLPGVESTNVFTLRDFADVQRIKTKLDSGSVRRAVIIGAGVLGLEVAESLLARQVEVTLLERGPQLFTGKLEAEKAAAAAATVKALPGLSLRFDAGVTGVDGGGVILANGEKLPADLIFFATGCAPRFPAELPENLQVKRGIIVDDFLQSSVPGIFACGDAMQIQDRCFGLFSDARNSGKCAGNCAVGNMVKYDIQQPSAMRCFACGLKLVM